VFVCVVDPGVGGSRPPLALQADGRWYVGPGNGLFELVRRRADTTACWEITWRPERLSASFHGRDLFAPVAARLARGEAPPGEAVAPTPSAQCDWPDDLPAVIYVDGYGNAMTGLRGNQVPATAGLAVAGRTLASALTFSDRAEGEPFWYVNANGLVEIAVNRGNAAALLGLAPGTPLTLT